MFYQKLLPEAVETLALESLTEALDTFKPGLTDRKRIGADGIPYEAYIKTIDFLKGKLSLFYSLGREFSCVEAAVGLEALRDKERLIESTMLADSQYSTFKGALYALSQCIFAVGKLDALGIDIIPEYLITVISDVARGFAFKQFYYIYDKTGNLSDGEKAYKITGGNTTARGEADKGYKFPIEAGLTDDDASTLYLKLMVSTVDSGIVAKNGMDIHDMTIEKAKSVLAGDLSAEDFDNWLLENKVSPKAAMSLLCVSLFARRICKKN